MSASHIWRSVLIQEVLHMPSRRFLAVLCASVLLALPAAVLAEHDGDDDPGRHEVLAACDPAWDPNDARIATWNGKTLHGEAFEVRDLFYRKWGGNDLEGDRQLRRWRWEYDCMHPRPVDGSSPSSSSTVTVAAAQLPPPPAATPAPTPAATPAPTPAMTPAPTSATCNDPLTCLCPEAIDADGDGIPDPEAFFIC